MKIKELKEFIGDKLNTNPKLSIFAMDTIYNNELWTIHDFQITDNRVYLSAMNDPLLPTFNLSNALSIFEPENEEKELVISFTDFTGELDEITEVSAGDIGHSENHFYLDV